jgi:hypothetical protein
MIPVRRQGRLNDGKRLRAIDPGGEARPDGVFLVEIRSASGDPQQQRDDRIDRKTDRRQVAGPTVAGRGVAPTGRPPAEDRSVSLPIRRPSRNDRRPRRDSDRPRARSGAASRAGAGRERKAAGQPTILTILDNRRRFGEREIAVDRDRRAAARLIALNSGLFRSPASNDRDLAMTAIPLCTSAPSRPGAGRARAVIAMAAARP